MGHVFTEEEKRFINSQKTLRFNSITPEGQVHSVPVCFAFDGKSFIFHRRRRGRQRWKNVEKSNRASLELDVYTDDWSGNAGILIYGSVKFLDSGPEHDEGLSLIKQKYAQYRGDSGLSSETPVVIFEPSKAVSWHH